MAVPLVQTAAAVAAVGFGGRPPFMTSTHELLGPRPGSTSKAVDEAVRLALDTSRAAVRGHTDTQQIHPGRTAVFVHHVDGAGAPALSLEVVVGVTERCIPASAVFDLITGTDSYVVRANAASAPLVSRSGMPQLSGRPALVVVVLAVSSWAATRFLRPTEPRDVDAVERLADRLSHLFASTLAVFQVTVADATHADATALAQRAEAAVLQLFEAGRRQPAVVDFAYYCAVCWSRTLGDFVSELPQSVAACDALSAALVGAIEAAGEDG